MFKIVDDSDLTQLEELLRSSRTHDGNVRQSAGLAPLVLAVACNKPDAVRLLLQLGADVNRPVDNVVWLPDGDEDNIRGRYILKSGPPLLSANSTEVLELLLKATSEVIKINIDDWSKLWQLTIMRGSPAMLCSLLASKCQPIGYRGDVNIALQQLLTEAVEYRSEVAVKHLLDLGANPNSTLANTFKLNHRVQQQGLLNPNNLKCPLQIAMSLNNVPMCTKLLDRGAILSSVVLLEGNMETQQNLLESVTDAAVQVKPDEWGKLCRMAIKQNAEKLFSLLVTKCQWHDDKKPLPIPVKNELQKLLLAAVDCDSDAFVGHLLDLGADPNRPGTLPNIYVQKSPLYVAISKNNVSRCNLLFSRGAVLKSSFLLAGSVHTQQVLLQNVTGVLGVTLDDWAKLLRGAIEEDAQTLFPLLATKFQLEQASNTNVKNDLQRLLFEAIERDCEAAINCLLDFGADPNGEVVFGDWKQGPLFVAAERKRLSLCYLLISRGALLNCSEQYKDPMIQAVLYDSVIAAETLLCVGSTCRCNDQLALNMWGEVGELVNGSSRGSLPCPHQGANGTLLHYAIVFGNLSIVRFMVEACRANLEATDTFGNTALLFATSRLLPDIVEFLLEAHSAKGLDVVRYMAQRNHKGNSALFYALSSMTAVDAQELAATELRIVESFVKRNVDLSQETFATCGCVLATAILCNRADLLRDLVVKCGISLFVLNQPCIHVNVYDVYPLTLAVEEKHVDCVKALVELGASISCYGNRMPLLHFIVSSKSDSLKYFQAGMFDVLDKKGVNWHATHDDQGSALHVALKTNCDIEIVQFLLARCDQLISLKTGSDTSILANAIPYKSVKLIEALLSHGADVNEFSQGKPLLHCVIEHCSSQYAADGEESCRAFLLQVFELLDKYEVNWSCTLTPAGVSGGNQRQQSAVRHHHHHRPRTVRWQVTPTASNNSQARVDVIGEVTVLHAAILHHCHPDVIGYCLNKYPHAVNINIIEYEEERDILKLAFMSTWDSHVVSVCEMLVTAGAALPANVLNGYLLRGRLPRRQVIELLVMAGCNVRPNRELLHQAIFNQYWHLVIMLVHTFDRTCLSALSSIEGAQTIPASLPAERKALLQPSDVITLAGLSRQVIREQLRGHTGHTSIIPAAFRLPLPRAIQQYILLSDLRRCNVDPFPPHHCHFFDDCDPNM